ncbi:MAG: hypothetical protein ACRCW0_00825 [Clostridium sp.]
MENFELIKELVTDREIYSEYDHLAIKVKNANKDIRIDVKNLYDELRKNNASDEDFLFEMAKLLVICEGVLDFNKMSLEEFKELIGENNLLCEDFEDVLNDVIIVMSRCIKHELQQNTILIQQQTIEALNLELQTDLAAFYDATIDSERNIRKVKNKQRDIKAQKQAINGINTSEIESVSRRDIRKLKRQIEKQAKKNKKAIEKENGRL